MRIYYFYTDLYLELRFYSYYELKLYFPSNPKLIMVLIQDHIYKNIIVIFFLFPYK